VREFAAGFLLDARVQVLSLVSPERRKPRRDACRAHAGETQEAIRIMRDTFPCRADERNMHHQANFQSSGKEPRRYLRPADIIAHATNPANIPERCFLEFVEYAAEERRSGSTSSAAMPFRPHANAPARFIDYSCHAQSSRYRTAPRNYAKMTPRATPQEHTPRYRRDIRDAI